MEEHPLKTFIKAEELMPGFIQPIDLEDAQSTYMAKQRVKPLCERCKRLDFSRLGHPSAREIALIIQGEQDVPEWLNLVETRYIFIRPAAYLQANVANCRLCELLWKELRKSNKGEDPPVELNGKPTICGLRSEPFANVKIQTRVGESGKFDLPRLSIAIGPAQEADELLAPADGIKDIFPDALVKSFFCFQISHPGQFSVKEYCQAGHTPPGHFFPNVTTFSGRLRPLKVDIRLLKHWIERCESGHCSTCLKTEPLNIGSIRLINVQKGSVETISTSSNRRYIALSYVWGDEDQPVKLTKSNASELSQDGALFDKTLPKTIEHSIKLTRDLGFDYLWIDALCIPQDEDETIKERLKCLGYSDSFINFASFPQSDDDEKFEQLNKMDKIYGGAFLTLVAAAGEGVRHGLPGYDSNRPHFQEQVFVTRKIGENVEEGTVKMMRDVLLMTTLRPQKLDQDHYLQGTKWHTRGWTAQERVLSNRCLIFTEEQVYWECNDGSFCEESQFDWEQVTRYSREPSLLPTIDPAVSEGAPSTSEDPTISAALPNYENMSKHYWHLVLRYSLRELRHDKDYLYAFTGILNGLTSSWGEEFYWGIPRTSFEHSLMWSGGDGGSRMAFHSTRDFTGVTWALPFPTWSWLAWKGSVWLPVSDGTTSYLAQAHEGPHIAHRLHYAEHKPEIICYAFDPEELKYDKSKRTWTIGESAIKQISDIRSTQPLWLAQVAKPEITPSFWRPRLGYDIFLGETGLELSETLLPEHSLPLRANFEVTTDQALVSLGLYSSEGVKFKVGLGDGPQTLVFFWASSAKFTLSLKDAVPSAQFLYDPSDPRKILGWHMCPAILDDAGKPVGYVNPMFEWFYDKWDLNAGKQEFVVVGSYNENDTESTGAKLDVMLIKWHGSVAKRATVGYIWEEHWIKAKRKWKLIALG